jgi:hypothetical protein
VSGRYCLDDSLLKKDESFIDPMCSLFLSSSHIGLDDLILLPKSHTVGIWVSYLVSYA